MGRLVDIDAVRKAIKKEWDGYWGSYPAKEIIEDTIQAVEQVEEVEAIPVKELERIAQVLRNSREYELRVVGNAIPGIVSAWKENKKENEAD